MASVALVGLILLTVMTVFIARPHFLSDTFTDPTSTTAATPPPATVPQGATEGDMPPSQPSTPTIPKEAQVEFVYPRKGLEIDPGQDVVVSGTVAGLGSNTLWILSRHDVGGSFYLVPGVANSSSFITKIAKDGPWIVTDEGVGNSSDKGGNIVYYAVQANADCTRTLSSMRNYDSFKEIPKGCAIRGRRSIQVR